MEQVFLIAKPIQLLVHTGRSRIDLQFELP